MLREETFNVNASRPALTRSLLYSKKSKLIIDNDQSVSGTKLIRSIFNRNSFVYFCILFPPEFFFFNFHNILHDFLSFFVHCFAQSLLACKRITKKFSHSEGKNVSSFFSPFSFQKNKIQSLKFQRNQTYDHLPNTRVQLTGINHCFVFYLFIWLKCDFGCMLP